MAVKQFYATGDFRYATRMMRAGDGPISMDAPTARLYTALGKISPDKPKKVATTPPPAPSFVPNTSEDREVPKRAPRKRAAKKAK
jgi:hypothetical protein